MPGQDLDRAAAAQYGELINAAYDMFAAQPHNLTPTPSPRFAPLWKHIAWIDMKDFIFEFSDPRFYGVVLQATDATKGPFDYAVAIRGTEGPLEWIDDAMAVPVAFSSVPASGRVAYGFDRIYSTLNVTHAASGARLRDGGAAQLTFAQQLNALVKAEPPLDKDSRADTGEPKGRFLVLGHSLGAALATLYVMENCSLETVQYIDTICTFASPRVGWADFVGHFDALTAKMKSWRLTNVDDLVTHVPFKLLGYQDVAQGTEFVGSRVARNDPICMHNMRTYQHWLDPGAFAVPTGCALPSNIERADEGRALPTRAAWTATVNAAAKEADGIINVTISASIPLASLK